MRFRWRRSIFSNLGLGIDLDDNGVSTNDVLDVDFARQNFPVLTSAIIQSAQLTVTGTLNTTSNQVFRLEFFDSDTCSTFGYGQGKTYLGATNVSTSGTGNASFTFIASGLFGSPHVITATATDTNNNTSEFSPCFEATNTSPLLIVALLSTNQPQIELRWPSVVTGFNLQTATNPNPPVAWSAVTNNVSDNGTHHFVTLLVNRAEPVRFFRLANP